MKLPSVLELTRQAGPLLLLVLPWLWPFANGPSPAVQPWLGSAACAILLWLFRACLTVPLVAAGWMSAALISSAMGLLQYFGHADQLSPWLHAAGLGEAYANLRQRNQFATLTAMGLAALLWWGSAPSQRQATTAAKALSIAAAVLMAVGNAASSSRTGLLQLLMLAMLLVIWRSWRQGWPPRLLMVALLSYGAATVVLPLLTGLSLAEHGIGARLLNETLPCSSRKVLWSNVLHLISLHPWLGWGWGELDYAHFMTPYEGPRFCEILDNAHNLPLHLAVELGLPAAIFLCGAAIALVLRMQPWKETNPERQLGWAVLGLILLHSMLEYPMWFGPFQIAVLLCGWLLLTASHAGALADAKRWRPQKSKEYAIALCLLAGIAYAAWDYYRISQIFYPSEDRSPAYREDTLEKVRDSRLFRDQVQFAEFTITPLTHENAARLHTMGKQVLHFSPEAQVVEKIIDSATLLGRNEEEVLYVERYRAAYAKEYARWARRQTP